MNDDHARFGDLRPGDLIEFEKRGMMVLSAVNDPVRYVTFVTLLKLWGTDGSMFLGGKVLKQRVYCSTTYFPKTWNVISRNLDKEM